MVSGDSWWSSCRSFSDCEGIAVDAVLVSARVGEIRLDSFSRLFLAVDLVCYGLEREGRFQRRHRRSDGDLAFPSVHAVLRCMDQARYQKAAVRWRIIPQFFLLAHPMALSGGSRRDDDGAGWFWSAYRMSSSATGSAIFDSQITLLGGAAAGAGDLAFTRSDMSGWLSFFLRLRSASTPGIRTAWRAKRRVILSGSRQC